MKIFRNEDHVFEELGRDPDGYEKLLKKLRRERAGIFWILLGILIVLAIGFGWACYVYTAHVFSPSYLTDKEPPFVAWWTANSRGVYMALGSAFIPFFFTQGLILSRLDAQLKMLLFLRGQRSIAQPDLAGNPKASE